MNKNKRMTFSIPGNRITFSQSQNDKGESVMTLKGMSILWNQLSSDRGGYKVKLNPGSATFAPQVFALYHHDFKDVIGNTANGSLRIGQATDEGIPVEIDLPDTTTGRDVAELVSKGYIGGMSFSMMNGFEDMDEEDDDGQMVYSVNRFTVDEVTITPIPAFSNTSIEPADDDDDDQDQDQPVQVVGGMSRVVAENKLQLARLHTLSL